MAMIADTQFKILSEEQMRWVQFRAQSIFQELKEEEQWNNFCRRNAQDSVEEEIIKSDAAIQVEPEKTVPKTILQSRTFSQKVQKAPVIIQREKTNNVRIDPSTKDLHVIIEKLEFLQTSVLELKSNQSQVTRNEGNSNENYTLPSIGSVKKQHKNVSRSDMIRSAIASAFTKSEENIVPKTSARSRGIGFLLPYCLREERMLAKRALDRSMIVKPVFKTANAKRTPPKKQVKFSSMPPHEEAKGKQMNKIQTSKVKKSKLTKTSEKDLKDQSVGKASNQSTDSIDRMIPHATNTKQRNSNDIAMLEKRMNEIEHIENTVRQRINNLKTTSSISNMTFVLPQSSENVKKAQLRDFDNLYVKAGTSATGVKVVENKSATVQLPNNTNMANFTTAEPISLHDELLASKLSTIDTGQTELSIDRSTLKSIHHHRKLYGQYLRRIAHQKVGDFNPWTVADRMSDLILDDCIEEVAQELNKIPSSFVVDIYNQEFTQSLL